MPTPTEALATLGPRAALTSAHHTNTIVNTLMGTDAITDWIVDVIYNNIGGGTYYSLSISPTNRTITRACSPNTVQPIVGMVVIDTYFNMDDTLRDPYADDYDNLYDYLREKITRILLDERNY
ncbi:MAG: hypothetical protein RR609_06670 [Aurantimicrobium sp.]